MSSETKPGDYLSDLTFEQIGQCVKNMVAMLPGILEKDADHIGRCLCVASGVAPKPVQKRAEELSLDYPMQPLFRDNQNTIRFKQNSIIGFMLSKIEGGLNTIHTYPFSNHEFQQLAQLIGYSVERYEELSYVSVEAAERVDTQLRLFLEQEKSAE